jgi:DNA polymerase V
MEKLNSSKTLTLEFFTPDYSTSAEIPFVEGGLKAGFPSPADDFLEDKIDFNKEFIRNKNATFYARVNGNSMKDAGIFDGDILVVDRSIEPQNDKIAVCVIDGEFTVKRIRIEKETVWLIPENDEFKPIKVTPENDFIVWGIVIASIKKF